MKTIAEALAAKPERLLFCLAAYYLAQVVVRLLIPNALRIDEAQQVFLSQWLMAGYDAQPPLYNWMQYAAFAVTGNYLLGLAVMKALTLFAIMASYYVLGCMVLKSRAYAVLACIGLFLTPQVFWQAQRDLTHTTATMLLVNLLMIAAIQTIRKPNLTNYVLLGAAIGFGLLSKYNFAILLAPLIAAVFVLPEGRARLLDRRMLVTVALVLAIVAPHLYWLFYHVDVASEVTASRMATGAEQLGRLSEILTGTAGLIGSSVVVALPSTLLLMLSFGRDFPKALKSRDRWSNFFLTILAGIFLTLFLMVLVLTLTTFRDRWLLPLLQIVPLLICLRLEAADLDGKAALQRVVPGVLLFMALLLPVTYTIARFDTDSDYLQPFDAFSETLRRQTGLNEMGVIVTGNWLMAGNIKNQFPESPVVATDFENLRLPYVWRKDRPILLIWRGGAAMPDAIVDWLSDETDVDPESLSINTIDLPVTGFPDRMAASFQYIVLRPADG